MSLTPEQARNSVRPGDLVVTSDNDVVRAVAILTETGDVAEDGMKAARITTEGTEGIVPVEWADVEKYVPREDDTTVFDLLDFVEEELEDEGDQEKATLATVDDGGELTPSEPSDDGGGDA